MNSRMLLVVFVISAAMISGCTHDRWHAGACNSPPGPAAAGYGAAPYYEGAAPGPGVVPQAAPGFGAGGSVPVVRGRVDRRLCDIQ